MVQMEECLPSKCKALSSNPGPVVWGGGGEDKKLEA
jgi:hypothetical protein